MVVMVVPALTTLFLGYLVESHCLCLQHTCTGYAQALGNFLQAEGCPWPWSWRSGSYMGESSLERGLGMPLKGTEDVLCVRIRVLTYTCVYRQHWYLL